jgi:hypothetical protein
MLQILKKKTCPCNQKPSKPLNIRFDFNRNLLHPKKSLVYWMNVVILSLPGGSIEVEV